MVNILNILRWILFLPAAILGGMAFSAILLVPAYYIKFLEEFFLYWFFLGSSSSAIFLLIGFSIAPRVNALVKWSLLVCLALFVIQYVIGFLLEPFEVVKLLYPISVSFAIYQVAKETVNDLQSSSLWKNSKKRM